MAGKEGITGSLPEGKPSRVKWLLHKFVSNMGDNQLTNELNIISGRIEVISLYNLDQVGSNLTAITLG
jgi:hypothetical protein